MPELPEVENLRLGLERSILGQKIMKVSVKKPKLVSSSGTIRKASKKKQQEFIKSLTGEKFLKVERRAKNLIFKLSNNKVILVHLKMSGQFVYQPKKGKQNIIGGHPIELSETILPNKHSHVIFELQKGTLFYNDTRMFGYLLYYPSQEAFEKQNHFEKVGLEPFDKKFTLKYFIEKLKNKNKKIKTTLMGQTIVTGLGNIYVDESLFESGIHPNRNTKSLKEAEIKKLYSNIKSILKKAIEAGGSSVATYRLLDDSRGNYARNHKVYGKAGKPCKKCKAILQKTLINNRTTVFCPNCQE